MSRTRASAKKAGTAFESAVADYLARATGDDRIERRAKSGAKDRGDIGGVRIHGRRCVVECKSYAGADRMAEWLREAEEERGNDDADYGVVVSKAVGVGLSAGSMGRQRVTMTLETFAALVAGGRDLLVTEG